jgi:hypothetical protein
VPGRSQFLTEDSEDGALEAVPDAGNSQPWMALRDSLQPWVSRKVIPYLDRIGVEVENAPNALDNLGQSLMCGYRVADREQCGYGDLD